MIKRLRIICSDSLTYYLSHVHIVEYLLESGADTGIKTNGWMPVQCADGENKDAIVNLIKH